ncbi:MAG: hypothetical protein GX447_02815 [Elusimicrobia bacterium]|nr:hypothetical protein [Elusimicrobiota bacterium]
MKIKAAALALIFSLTYAYCGDFNPSFSRGDLDSISVPVPQKTIDIASGNKAASVKKWTIMVFLNGKNDLEMAGLLNMNQMEMVGSNKDINIIVEMGRMNGQAQGDTDLDGNWTGVRRYYVKKDTDTEHITSQIVFQQASYDMGDYKQAVNFLKWTKQNYPAQKYMLILWDHGTGWMDPQQKKKSDSKGISFDDETGNYIRTKQIGDILKEGGDVDILAFDACLMQMTEVASEVKDKTKVIVGSEETIPGTGYPYNLWLAALAKKPSMSEEELGAVVVEAYKQFYTYIKRGAMLSAIRSSKISQLNALIADFAKLAVQANDIEAIKKARTETLRFDILGPDDADKTISFFGDLYQFADIMGKNITKTEPAAVQLKAKIEELKNFISGQLVIYKGYYGNERAGKSLADANGISIYIPPAETRVQQAKLEAIFEAPYSTFEFDKATKWHDFVDFMYANVK